MANYLYNGVKLPALPEWDKETYPYAYIQDGSNLIPPGARAIILRVFEVPVYAIGNAVSTTAATNSITWKCPITDAVEWTGRTETTYEADASCGGNAIWTNTDILNMDGTLYLAASDPVPVSVPKWVHMNSFLKGLAFGLAGKPLEFAPGKEPVAFLYNGVRLPKLPEWDREAYPYAFIRNVSSGTDYNELYVFKTEPAWFKTTLLSAYGVEDGNTHLKAVDYPYGSDEDWGYATLSERTSSGYLSSINFEGIFWANFDVLNEDGTVFLAASEPIPVYE